jgi:hypothetical protein
MFPPVAETAIGTELSNCARILPSSSTDGGGFFVALIRRRLAPDGSSAAERYRKGDKVIVKKHVTCLRTR